jgi:HK97 family phage portal protein
MDKPSFGHRLKTAWNVFRNGFPAVRSGASAPGGKAAGVSGAPYLWTSWQENTPQWSTIAFESFVEEGFNRNSIIYAAIMYKARSKMSAPLRAYTGDPSRPEALPPDDPLTKLVSRPNTQQSWPEFGALMEIYYNLGNCFVLLIRPRGGGLPESMFTLRPDRVRIIPSKNGIKGYLYVPQGATLKDATPIAPEDMIHVKLPNPNDPLEGMGWGMPPLAIAQSADVDNEITRFLKLFFQNGAMPLGLLKFDVPLEDEDMAAVKRRWSDIYGGVDNWSEVGVLDQGGEYQRIGSNFDEMGFSTLDERNESRILMPFGVHPALLGTRISLLHSPLSNSNFAAVRQAYWEDTAVPELKLFEKEFQYFLSSEDGGFVAYDFSKVPALLQDKAKLIDSAHKMWTMGTPANQAYETVGLRVSDIPGGDIAYVPANLVPVGMETDDNEQTMEGSVDVEDDDRKDRQPPADTQQLKQAESEDPEELLQDYRDGMGELVSSAVLGEISRTEFEAAMRTLVDEFYPVLFLAGANLADLGVLSRGELAEYEAELEIAQQSVDNFSNDIYEVERYAGDDGLEMAENRVSVWRNKAAGLLALGMLFLPGDPLLTWIYGDTEHCNDCARLNGQVHRQSEWRQSGWRPQSSGLECNGYHCECRYKEVPAGTPTSGTFAAPMILVTKENVNGNGAMR